MSTTQLTRRIREEGRAAFVRIMEQIAGQIHDMNLVMDSGIILGHGFTRAPRESQLSRNSSLLDFQEAVIILDIIMKTFSYRLLTQFNNMKLSL
jgi:hypothetical protein